MPARNTRSGSVGKREITGTTDHIAGKDLFCCRPVTNWWRPWARQRDVPATGRPRDIRYVTAKNIARHQISCASIADPRAGAVKSTIVEHAITFDRVTATRGINSDAYASTR
jgi:hypothetical protein